MSLVFTSCGAQSDPNQPGTHALVVGIGEYPYLGGGRREPPEGARFQLEQRASAPRSARAVRDWLLARGAYAGEPNAGLYNPSAPLATVDVLIADGNPEPGEPVDVPNAERLIEAIDAWVERCNRHADNVPFLFLCGHGLELGDLVLLASDFGAPGALDIWQRAISLDSIRLGMRRCQARRQFLFFDCCRSEPFDTFAGNARGHQFFATELDQADPRSYVALYSTLSGRFAYPDVDQPSTFTKALLEALLGLGSERRGGSWQVTNRMLAKAVHDSMQFAAKTNPNRQLASAEAPGDAVLHQLRVPPQVKVWLEAQQSLITPPAFIKTFELP
jgi:hypothetical protein